MNNLFKFILIALAIGLAFRIFEFYRQGADFVDAVQATVRNALKWLFTIIDPRNWFKLIQAVFDFGSNAFKEGFQRAFFKAENDFINIRSNPPSGGFFGGTDGNFEATL